MIVDLDLSFTRDQEIAFGMSFPIGGSEMAAYVKNLTDTNKPFPTDEDFKQIKAQHAACRSKNLLSLKQLKDQGLIDEDTWKMCVKEAMAKGCYVDYSGVPAFLVAKHGSPGSMVTLDEILAFKTSGLSGETLTQWLPKRMADNSLKLKPTEVEPK